jgi:hypothetical protein
MSKKVWGYGATILAANTGIYLIGSGHPVFGSLAVFASFGANYCTEFGMPARRIPKSSPQVELPKVEKVMAEARS